MLIKGYKYANELDENGKIKYDVDGKAIVIVTEFEYEELEEW